MDPSARPHAPALRIETVHDGRVVRIRLHGEADAADLTALEAGLAGITLDGQRQVRLDLSDLDFMDVAALRELTLFARHLRDSGYAVRTCGAQPLLEHLMRLTGADADLGLA